MIKNELDYNFLVKCISRLPLGIELLLPTGKWPLPSSEEKLDYHFRDWRLFIPLDSPFEFRYFHKKVFPGSCLVIPPECRVDILGNSGEAIILSLSIGSLEYAWQKGTRIKKMSVECHLNNSVSIELRENFIKLRKEILSKKALKSLKSQITFNKIILRMVECSKPKYFKSKEKVPRQVFIKLNKAILSNISLSYNAEFMSQKMGKSIQYLNGLVQRYRNMSLKKYVNFCRLEYAKHLLIQSTLKVKELPCSCGFSDLNHFIQSFRNHTGYSPGNFKSLWRAATDIQQRNELISVKSLNILSPQEPGTTIISEARSTLLLTNLSTHVCKVFWLSPENHMILMWILQPGESTNIGVRCHAYWVVEVNSLKKYYYIHESNNQIIIN